MAQRVGRPASTLRAAGWGTRAAKVESKGHQGQGTRALHAAGLGGAWAEEGEGSLTLDRATAERHRRRRAAQWGCFTAPEHLWWWHERGPSCQHDEDTMAVTRS